MKRHLAVSLVALAIAGCDHYEAPCRLASEVVVVDDGAETSFSLVDAPEIGLVRLRYGPLADGGGASLGSVSVRIPTGADALRIDDDGHVVSRQSFIAPKELSLRKGSTSDIGVVATDGAALFHWVEESTQTEPDGATTTSAVLRLESVGSDGRAGDLVSPTLAQCTDCKLTSSAATYGGAMLVLYTKAFSSTSPAVKGDPEVGLVTISGPLVGSTDVPWLAALVRKFGVPRIDTTGDLLLCFTGTSAWSVDGALAPKAGPLVLPSAASAFQWKPEQDDAVVVWSSPASDGGNTGTLPDLVVRDLGSGGAAHGPIVRISTALRVFDVARDGDRTGVVLGADDGHAYFALLGPDGRKIGGDLDMGRAFVGSSHVLRARGAGRFVDVLSSGSRVLRREVLCGR